MRVVSLLPSATETLAAIGAADLLVGRSHECDWPASIADRPVLTAQRVDPDASSAEIDRQVHEQFESGGATSLYTIDEARLRALEPDLILTQDLCEVCSIDLNTVRRIAADLSPTPEIVSLNPTSLEEVFDDLLRVGEAVDRPDDAKRAMVELRERYFSAKDHVNAYMTGPEVAFLEWIDPIFVGGHWTPQLIEAAGGTHSLNPPGAKSRAVEPLELVEAQPEWLVVAPCGMTLERVARELDEIIPASRWWNTLPAVADGRVALVDGSAMFNRPGPRLVDAFEWLVGWLHDRPDLIPVDFPWRPLAGAPRMID
ncbi:MAG: ABC transporter substrate-binding protein [Phycisphaerales bacterium]